MDSTGHYQQHYLLASANFGPTQLGRPDESLMSSFSPSFSPSSYRSEEADQIVPDTASFAGARHYAQANPSVSPNTIIGRSQSIWSPKYEVSSLSSAQLFNFSPVTAS